MSVIIAIDGYAGTGKSTLARDLANALGYTYLDTGAMYRAVTLYLLRNDISWLDAEKLGRALQNIRIEFRISPDNGKRHTYLNGEDVEADIRSMAVSGVVSEVAAVSAIRRFLVEQQRQIGMEQDCVLDGRDIGTVVFPDARFKFFITAPMEVRIARRLGELFRAGADIDADAVQANLEKRDREETQREDSPLRPAPDAVHLDTGGLDREQQLAAALKHIEAQ